MSIPYNSAVTLKKVKSEKVKKVRKVSPTPESDLLFYTFFYQFRGSARAQAQNQAFAKAGKPLCFLGIPCSPPSWTTRCTRNAYKTLHLVRDPPNVKFCNPGIVQMLINPYVSGGIRLPGVGSYLKT